MPSVLTTSPKPARLTAARSSKENDMARQVKGHFAIELALWVLFFPAGIVYSIWRHT